MNHLSKLSHNPLAPTTLSFAVRSLSSTRARISGDARLLRALQFRMLGLCVLLFAIATSSCTQPSPGLAPTATTAETVASTIDTAGVAVSGSVATDAPSDSLTTKPAILRYRPTSGGLIIPDPTVESAANGFLFAEVFSGLTKPSHSNPGGIEPDLAESDQISDDGLEYTFRLRDGIRLSDGTLVTPQDVKWSWERAAPRNSFH